MENQLVDRLTIENLIPTTSTESLAKGYILTCKSEGKSPNTIAIYEPVLRNFILAAVHLAYLSKCPIIMLNKNSPNHIVRQAYTLNHSSRLYFIP